MVISNLIKKKGSNNKEIARMLNRVKADAIHIKEDNSFVADDILLDALKDNYNIIVVPFASINTDYDSSKYSGTCMVTEGKDVYSVCYKKAFNGLQEQILIDFDTIKFAYSV